MNRKKFIVTSSLAFFSMSTFGSLIKMENGKFKGDCETTNDILGPFYRPNAPFRSNLISDDKTGTRIEIKGKVYKSDCVTELENALVEIWHCNPEGEYDNESKDYNYRASLKTNNKGEYSFLTILPGKYLNGDLYRPAHIHFRVTEENSKELISQIYFKGDPHIEKDPWASKQKAEFRILELRPEDIKGNLTVTFDVYLQEK